MANFETKVRNTFRSFVNGMNTPHSQPSGTKSDPYGIGWQVGCLLP